MKIIIVGYGRVGTQVFQLLSNKNHSIVILDKDRSTLERTSEETHARVLIGDAVDPDLLRQAGADKADVLLALTREENTNLMVAQMARVAFNIPKVIALVYDPQRERSFYSAGVEALTLTVTGAQLLAAEIEGTPIPTPSLLTRSGEGSLNPAELSPLVQPRPTADTGPYYVLIMGGGKVGYYLGRTLLEEGHEATIVEANPEVYGLVSRQLDCPVILGDGSTYAVLEK
ncbi:MAG: NAD-binding protein, partial [Acidobacteria bacterium]|nr:NAD-binding protein [Acidobacteriota bacterium]